SSIRGELKQGEVLTCGVVRYSHFRLFKKETETVFIATETGVGPIVAMSQSSTSKRPLSKRNPGNSKPQQKLRLYWGGKNPASLELYESFIDQALAEKKLDRFIPAYSRLDPQKVYVQHLIKRDGLEIAQTLKSGGCVMICGSIAMQDEVIKELQGICNCYLTKDLSYFQNKKQIKMDCY